MTQQDLQDTNKPGCSHLSQTQQSPSKSSLKGWAVGEGKKNQILIQRNNSLDRAQECQQVMQILSASHFLVPPSYSERLHQPVNTLRHPTHPGISLPQEALRWPGGPPQGPHGGRFFSLYTEYHHHTIPSEFKSVFGLSHRSHSVTWLGLNVYETDQYIYASFGQLGKKYLMLSHLEEENM